MRPVASEPHQGVGGCCLRSNRSHGTSVRMATNPVHETECVEAVTVLEPGVPTAFVATRLPWITKEEGHTIDEVLATLSMVAPPRTEVLAYPK
jgi:hypothetical protein